MPELPEVETVRRTLLNMIKGQTIEKVTVLYPNIIDGDVDGFKRALNGRRIVDIKRRGKYLIFELDHNITFYSHLRMEGKYYVQDIDDPYDKHTHVIFDLNDKRQLRYHDTRKFGRMGLIERSDYQNFKGLGPEPFDNAFNRAYVKTFLSKKRLPIKTVLLDQRFVAGIGNIYADEIVFCMRVDPRVRACDINDEDIDNLIKYTREIMQKAIAMGGTTIRSYTSSLGVTGRFQNELYIHTKEICPICHGKVQKISLQGRGTYYCPVCQKER